MQEVMAVVAVGLCSMLSIAAVVKSRFLRIDAPTLLLLSTYGCVS